MLRVPPHHVLSSDQSGSFRAQLVTLRAAFLTTPPTPMPAHGEFSRLVCWPFSDASTFLGWDCVLPRKAATHSGCLISTGTSCGPASCRPHPGSTQGLPGSSGDEPRSAPWVGLSTREFYSLHASQGALGHSWASAAGRAEPGQVCCPVTGTVTCTYATSCPQHCVGPATAARGAQGGHMPHAVAWVRHWAPLAQTIFLQGPQWSRSVSWLCSAPPRVGGSRERPPAQCAQRSLGSILLFMETQTWCPRAHPVQGWDPGS